MTISLLQTSGATDDFIGQISVLSKSDGSASWQQNKGTTVVSSVNGPLEVRLRDEVLGEATLELKILPSSGLGGTRERYMENLVRSAVRPCLLLGLHARSLIQITSQVIAQGEDNNEILEAIAATLNSIVFASVDAGLSMSCMLAAAVVHSPESGTHVACYSFPARELIMLESRGPFNRNKLPELLKEALDKCTTVNEYMRNTIEERIATENRWHSQT